MSLAIQRGLIAARALPGKFSKAQAKAAVVGLSLVPMFASAAEGDIDTSKALLGIAAVTVAVLAVIAAMTAFRVSKWGAAQVAKLFGR